jgi:hypothetical protein
LYVDEVTKVCRNLPTSLVRKNTLQRKPTILAPIFYFISGANADCASNGATAPLAAGTRLFPQGVAPKGERFRPVRFTGWSAACNSLFIQHDLK